MVDDKDKILGEREIEEDEKEEEKEKKEQEVNSESGK